jgi:hypothetical protein
MASAISMANVKVRVRGMCIFMVRINVTLDFV